VPHVPELALAELAAQKERELAEEREKNRQVQEHWAKVKADKDAAELVQRMKEEQERRTLEAHLQAEEAASEARRKHEKRLEEISQAAFMLEAAAKQAEADLQRASTPVVVEPEVNVKTNHPLAFLWKDAERTAPAEPDFVPTQVEPVPPPELRKVTTEESQALASVFLQHGVRISALAAQNLLLRFPPEDIEQTVKFVAQQGKTFTVDYIETILWRALDKPTMTPITPITPIVEPVVDESDPSTWEGQICGGA
jgi:hypothetical protein